MERDGRTMEGLVGSWRDGETAERELSRVAPFIINVSLFGNCDAGQETRPGKLDKSDRG